MQVRRLANKVRTLVKHENKTQHLIRSRTKQLRIDDENDNPA